MMIDSPQLVHSIYACEKPIYILTHPTQTKHTLIPSPGQGNLSPILTLNRLRDLLPLLLKKNPILRLGKFIKPSPKPTEEILQPLLRDIIRTNQSSLNGLFQRQQNILRHARLSEHAGGDLLAPLSSQKMRRAITPTR